MSVARIHSKSRHKCLRASYILRFMTRLVHLKWCSDVQGMEVDFWFPFQVSNRSIFEFQYHFDGLELRQWMCSLCSSSQGLGQSHQWSCRIKHLDYSGRWPWHLRHLHEEHKHDQRNPKEELTFEDNDLEKTEDIKDAYTPRLWKKTGTTDCREKAYSKTKQLWHFFKKEGLYSAMSTKMNDCFGNVCMLWRKCFQKHGCLAKGI